MFASSNAFNTWSLVSCEATYLTSMQLFISAPSFFRTSNYSPTTCSRPIRPLICASSTQPNTNSVSAWQQKFLLLLDPSLNSSARQVLIQDLAKTAPDALSDCNCKSAITGLADVARQVADVVPDIFSAAPKYAAKAVENIPNIVSRMADMEMSPASMPRTVEDVAVEFRNIFNRTPEGLFTPNYQVVSSREGYEIRNYPPMIMAVTAMKPDKDGDRVNEVESVNVMGQSFNSLAGYLFGKNQTKTAMKMTTPVVLSKGIADESMSFIIGEYENVDDIPETLDDTVTLQEEPSRMYAASQFTGYVTQAEARRQYEKLCTMLKRDAVELVDDEAYKCMIYNGPSTIASLRRNEMIIEVIYSQPKPDSDTTPNTATQ